MSNLSTSSTTSYKSTSATYHCTWVYVSTTGNYNYCIMSCEKHYLLCPFMQIDLIDMRHLPDGDFHWILHCIDHWSKFNFAYPLESKHAANVSAALGNHVFPYFGVPRILHSDNGCEFVNSLIEKLLESWHSDIQLVSGRPRHPQSQGVIERAHYTLQRKLSAELNRLKEKSPPSASWLPRLVCKSYAHACIRLSLCMYEVYFYRCYECSSA